MILAIQFSYFKKGNIFGERNRYKPQLLKKLKYSISIKNMCHINTLKEEYTGSFKNKPNNLMLSLCLKSEAAPNDLLTLL